ncbi:Transmembrane emp24 domain-containing protein p24beta2 [Bienertia sinuspersici]
MKFSRSISVAILLLTLSSLQQALVLDDGVDLWSIQFNSTQLSSVQVVKGPEGDQIHDARNQISEKFDFVAHKRGPYKFCLTNKSPYHETIDFDVQIEKLGEALYNIQFEQHWLEAQTDRQILVNESLSKRAIHKAILESIALVGATVLQVYLLRRLFEKKLGTSRV